MTLSASWVYISLALFLLGLIFKFYVWCSRRTGPEADRFSTGDRISGAIKAVFGAIFSARLGGLIKSFVVDGLLQIRLLKSDPGRWLAHICLYGGFMLLLLFHALDAYFVAPFADEYANTTNPYLWLRNLFGLICLIGMVLVIVRRSKTAGMKMTTSALDVGAIIAVALIIVSGFVLEGIKIGSYKSFDRMVAEWADPDDKDQVKALKAYWSTNYGVVFPDAKGPFDEDLLTEGEDANTTCIGCHSRPTTAFVSYGLAKVFRPAAVSLANSETVLWWVHILACLIALAVLPFTKLFHMVVTPLSLMINQVYDPAKIKPVNLATKQSLEFDACTHCAACTIHCSVGQVFRLHPNLAILPSEKLAAYKTLASGGDGAEALRDGNSICTRCHRCTDICPAGINLQALWFSLESDLDRRNLPETAPAMRLAAAKSGRPSGALEPKTDEFSAGLGLAEQSGAFAKCFECQTCTTVCPVVENYDRPGEALDLLPHQIMHSLSLGLGRDALSARMIWDCLTCYQCQENCPQGVQVTDVLYELKNQAVKAMKE